MISLKKSIQRSNPKLSSTLHRLRESGAWVEINFIPGGLAFIINRFVKERPLKMRGVNIDIFISKIPFHEIAIQSKLLKNKSKFWIEKTIYSDGDTRLGDAVIHYFSYDDKFMPRKFGYRDNDSFIIECGQNAFCFISNFRREHHRKVSKNLLAKMYPKVTRAFLTSHQMFEILDSADRETKYDLRIRQNYQYVIGKESESALEFHGGEVSDLPKVADLFRERKNIRRNLTMWKLIANASKEPFEITFSGDGHIGLYEGNFEEIFHLFIKPIIEKSSDRCKRFSKRSMSETDDRKAKPISIIFDSKPFTEKKDIFSTLEHIRKYTNCRYSIIHAGNPHLYMYVTDAIDFSTFSVRTLGVDKLIISPQIKTSPESLVRFAFHILEYPKLSDGEIIAEG